MTSVSASLEDRMKIQENLTLTLSKDAEAEKAKAEALAFALKETGRDAPQPE